MEQPTGLELFDAITPKLPARDDVREEQIAVARLTLEHADDPIYDGRDIALAHEILNYWAEVDRQRNRKSA